MTVATNKTRVSTYLDQEQYAEFQAYAERQRRTVSAQIAFLIDQALRKDKEEQQQG